jgi:hypothetical protein
MRVWRTVIGLAIAWVTAINVAFLAAVVKEFAPELFGTIMRVLS